MFLIPLPLLVTRVIKHVTPTNNPANEPIKHIDFI